MNDLALAPDLFINWEEGACSFDSSTFTAFLEELKKYSEKQYDISPSGTAAERLYRREYLTARISLYMDSNMEDYMNLKEILGEDLEIAGFPGANNEPRYRMLYNKIYGMNAASGNKEGAWAFLEYLLSEEVQREAASYEYPARLDVLNAALQETIDFQAPEHYRYSSYNPLTEETITERRPFTEQDRQTLLEMLDRVYRFSAMNTADVYDILLDELSYYLNGAKSAKETAELIQNRVQLYLIENQ